MVEEKSEAQKDDEIRALAKVTTFVTIPHGVDSEEPGILDVQADLSNNEVAKGLLYHRSTADRLSLLKKPSEGGKIEKGKDNVIIHFADLLSMLTWGAHRKSKEEAVLLGRGMQEEKPRTIIEQLEKLKLRPPEGDKRKLFGR